MKGGVCTYFTSFFKMCIVVTQHLCNVFTDDVNHIIQTNIIYINVSLTIGCVGTHLQTSLGHLVPQGLMCTRPWWDAPVQMLIQPVL